MRIILVADEDSRVRNLVRLVFTEHMGYRVFATSNGVDAILKTREMKPDVVLIDVSLSNQNGPKVSREIKNDPLLKDTYVILFTSASATLNKTKALVAWADNIVMKPFEPKELLKEVEHSTAKEMKDNSHFIGLIGERKITFLN